MNEDTTQPPADTAEPAVAATPAPAGPDWAKIRADYQSREMTRFAICRKHDISRAALDARARDARWKIPNFDAIERRLLIDRVMGILEQQIELAEKKIEEKEDRQMDKEAVLLGNIARNLEKLIDLDKAQAPGREVKAETAEMQDMRRQLAGRIDALVKR
jgi:hypothetical protein